LRKAEGVKYTYRVEFEKKKNWGQRGKQTEGKGEAMKKEGKRSLKMKWYSKEREG